MLNEKARVGEFLLSMAFVCHDKHCSGERQGIAKHWHCALITSPERCMLSISMHLTYLRGDICPRHQVGGWHHTAIHSPRGAQLAADSISAPLRASPPKTFLRTREATFEKQFAIWQEALLLKEVKHFTGHAQTALQIQAGLNMFDPF